MKRYISAAGLVIRPTIYKIMLLFGLSATGQYYLFSQSLENANQYFQQSLEQASSPVYYNPTVMTYLPGTRSFAQIISESKISMIFGLTMLLMCALLFISGCNFGSRKDYTLSRLSISPFSTHICWGLYFTFCFTMLIAFETVLCFAFGQIYLQEPAGSLVGNQAIFLSFYQNPFLHSLLPMSEASLMVRNTLSCLGLGMGSSYFSYRQRAQGRPSFSALLLALMAVFTFPQEIGSFMGDMFMILFVLVLTIRFLYKMRELAKNE